MDLSSIWDDLGGLTGDLTQTGLLLAAIIAVAVAFLGTALGRVAPGMAAFLRRSSTLVLACILVAVVIQVARMDSRFDLAVPQAGLPEQVVEGVETRIPLGPDGHFWIESEVNGQPVRFMVDTGATLIALNPDTARLAGLEPRRGGIPVRLNTANGSVPAQLTTIDELRFGNVAARGLDAVIAPNLGEVNVVGMNLLSRLKGWRVEGRTMILEPNNPQPALEG